ncbi:23S rRNA pseudouridine(2605) synthase RluB [Iodobacter fluviatilis]|uniref:Pseudouridine synthase n=1 Tax=Iodobacter fluviatilis TaxID=537 RepID=A0A377Q7R4_9NEIS|nr:pseudouridine synthase [Iodobacter fluviatilis]TCU88633.1 ribosomal large subunit pseudouridine synthase B [Iodobacter fluviatilis]STQ91296.1 Ribosomal large subunit pseudouridine synthase B [Iodobacter fluviatilis]
MKTTRSRRPQPAIAERKASERSAQAAGAGKRTGGKATGEEFSTRNPAYAKPAATGANSRGGKPAGEAGRNPAYGKSAVTGAKPRGRNAASGFAEAMPEQSRGGRSGRGAPSTAAAESRMPRAPRSKPNPQGGKAERPTFEAYKAVAAASAGIAPEGEVRKTKYKTVSRARRMQLRQGSVRELQMQKELRERRVATTEIPAERLQKALAFTGYGSRRAMEDAIAAGKVSVNGKIAALGSKVSLGDEVRFDGKKVVLKWPDRLPRIVMYHKQEGELVSRDDPEGRVTVFDRLPRLKSSKWVAVGRLDYNTSGLLLFTTSGELANRMMHPSFEVEREYAVRVFGELTQEQINEMLKGIELEDGTAHFARLERRGGEGFNHWYHVVLKEGRNREVRRMFEHFGLIVSRLIRVRFGSMTLPGRLRRGQFHELTELEILGIMRWAGLKINGRQADE